MLRLRHAALALCLALAGWSHSLAETPREALYRDLGQTMQARRLLLEDPQLGRLNLGVKVTRQVAVLWGPVPSQELSFRAEQRLRAMFELIEIQNRLTLEPEDGPMPNVAPAPERQFLPDVLPPVAPEPQRRPAFMPGERLELAAGEGFMPAVTAHSSPLAQSAPSPAAVRLPFLGSVVVPR